MQPNTCMQQTFFLFFLILLLFLLYENGEAALCLFSFSLRMGKEEENRLEGSMADIFRPCIFPNKLKKIS